MNPQLQALISEYLEDGSASNFAEAYALAIKNSGLTPSVGQIGASSSSAIPTEAANATAGAGAAARFLAGLKERIGPGKSLIHSDLKLPNLGKMASNLRQTQLWENGPKISTAANTISGLYQGGKALKGIYDNTQAESDLASLKNDINSEVAWNPMYASYLTGSDEKLMRQMKNNTMTNGVGDFASGALKGLPKAAISAILGGLTGGWAGAAIGGLGSLANSGIEGYGQGVTNAQNKLQGLYGKLRQANDDYQNMRRPLGMRNAGLQTRYYNQLY